MFETARNCGDEGTFRMTLNIKGAEYAFRLIPAGSFLMGSPEREKGRFDDEVLHKVNISRDFWLMESPVTQGMWKSAMRNNPSYFTGSDLLPVENISWNDCQEYIGKLNKLGICPEGYRFSLPTEAEWEYACRAGTTTPYWFGAALNGEQANCDGSCPYGTEERGPFLGKTTEVGRYPANGWGLYDMHGNVWEWCEDWHGVYPTGEVTDPAGPETGSNRVGRGGSWFDDAVYNRAAYRGWDEPDYRCGYVGARLALRVPVR